MLRAGVGLEDSVRAHHEPQRALQVAGLVKSAREVVGRQPHLRAVWNVSSPHLILNEEEGTLIRLCIPIVDTPFPVLSTLNVP